MAAHSAGCSGTRGIHGSHAAIGGVSQWRSALSSCGAYRNSARISSRWSDSTEFPRCAQRTRQNYGDERYERERQVGWGRFLRSVSSWFPSGWNFEGSCDTEWACFRAATVAEHDVDESNAARLVDGGRSGQCWRIRWQRLCDARISLADAWYSEWRPRDVRRSGPQRCTHQSEVSYLP